MTTQLSIDRDRTAVLIMDYQTSIVEAVTSGRDELLDKASSVLRGARRAGIPVIYIVVRFREGYPEVSPRNKAFSNVKRAGRLLEGSEEAEVHPGVAPEAGDLVVTKKRVGAFATTDLETILKARDITSLVLLGISIQWSSGIHHAMGLRRRLRDSGAGRLLLRPRRGGTSGAHPEDIPETEHRGKLPGLPPGHRRELNCGDGGSIPTSAFHQAILLKEGI